MMTDNVEIVGLRDELKAFGRSIGFDLIGVCDAGEFKRERAFLEQREREGIAPNPFEWPDVDQRVTPELLLPGVRSIVAVGMSYLASDGGTTEQPGLRGWMSRYCRGQDYHVVLEERLARLARWLEDRVEGARTLVHVDVGAPLDRAIAERAGLGMFGKSTNLIARGLGSWIFLGELLTTVALPSDVPRIWNVCGSCTRCLDACPTLCLTPGRIDSTRCLGYLNQMDGDVPAEFRAMMGNRLFGCDDCQDVCPYNRVAVADLHPEFAASAGVGVEPDLAELLAMDQPTFERIYGPTAAAWRGLETLQRNALIALGNSGNPAAFDLLAQARSSASPMLRRHAAWSLGRLVALRPELGPAVATCLREFFDAEIDTSVHEEIGAALNAIFNTTAD